MDLLRKSFLLFFVLVMFGAISIRAVPPETRTVLAIFAHPDDDITIGPLLAHYAKNGAQVYLAVATSGDQGTQAHAGIPAGEKLATAREEESRQASKSYGIHEPFFLREKDESLAGMEPHDRIVKRLKEIINQVKPSVIITFGAEGITGHPDHRAIGNLATEIVQMWPAEGVDGYSPQKLYYVSYPQSKFSKTVPPFPGPLGNVGDRFITTIVDSRDGLSGAAQAEFCYKSQHTPEIMAGINHMMERVFEGRMYLRLALSHATSRTSESDIFDRIVTNK